MPLASPKFGRAKMGRPCGQNGVALRHCCNSMPAVGIHIGCHAANVLNSVQTDELSGMTGLAVSAAERAANCLPCSDAGEPSQLQQNVEVHSQLFGRSFSR